MQFESTKSSKRRFSRGGWPTNSRWAFFCEFEKADAPFEIGLVSTLVLLDGTLAPVLLLAPFGGLAVEERGIDPTVELVEVHGVDPRLEAIVFRLQLRDGGLMVTTLVLMALAQGGPHPVHHLIVEGQVRQQVLELLF